ncbi:glycine cleavage system aminomethyltransferase GcvT [Herbiconiux sp. SYSU D00978]|uniref:glycine cleavage system aminomethyltransferase GcvT n=1 Tax=Herbiconiux sp. SYSU D00978 TaxID=2812562 RepID=UPI001A95BAF9|nr:glycine cleavage system aminomethyltransferase GcvT [Herbiconiux sp. SYSU D00978]
MTDLDRTSPLHDTHVAAGASFTDFAGWRMPVRYTSDLAEHHAVRTEAGIFDISHMANLRVEGAGAAAFLDAALTVNASAMLPGAARYALILTETGGIIDDLIVYRLDETLFHVVANAGNRFAVVAALQERLGDADATLTDETEGTAIVAVQGPAAQAILGDAGFGDAAALRYYSVRAVNGALVARTGYTGEDGFELYVPPAEASALWSALVAAGQPHGLVPAGLAARDTLRLEAGMPLYGHELSLDVLPAQAGLARVAPPKGKEADFVGRAAVEAGPPAGSRVLVGLVAEGRRAGRVGYPVLSGDTVVGEITSGALSPTLGHPIAMAFVDPEVAALGTPLFLDVRGSRIPAVVTDLPFYKRKA